MKISKKALMATTIAWLAFMTLVILPGFAQSTATLVAPEIVDLNLLPGQTLSIDITVADIEDLWGFQFVLSFNPEILTATGFSFYAPFVIPQPSVIAPNYVAVAANMPFGTEVGDGFYGTGPIAKIDFIKNADGSSVLRLSDSLLVNPGGAAIPHEVIHGSFSNVEVARWINLINAGAERTGWDESKDSDNTLSAKVKNKGSVDILVKAEFKISDESTLFQVIEETAAVTMKKNQIRDFTLTITRGWLIVRGATVPAYGKYYVQVRIYYFAEGAWNVVKDPADNIDEALFHFDLSP